MAGNPVRLRWAAALAALVGGVGGPFLGLSLSSGGLIPLGPLPLLAGDAAAMVIVVLGTVAGAGVAGTVAMVLGRKGGEREAAVVGSLAGWVAAAAAAEASPGIAQFWITTFAPYQLWGGIVGGMIAGGLAGTFCALLLKSVPPVGSLPPRNALFAALVGSIAGLISGIGGGGLGSVLAAATSVCPNGYYANPVVPTGACAAGVFAGGLLVGAWAGAPVGAVLAWAVYLGFRRLAGPPSKTDSPPGAH